MENAKADLRVSGYFVVDLNRSKKHVGYLEKFKLIEKKSCFCFPSMSVVAYSFTRDSSFTNRCTGLVRC